MSKFMKLLPVNFNSKGKTAKSSSTFNDAFELTSIPTVTDPPLLISSESEFHPSLPLYSIPNFLVVWLDANIDEINNTDSRNTLTELRQVVNPIYTFVHINYCLHFLKNIQNEKIFMIVSGSLGQTIVPMIHDLCRLSSIFIFCVDQLKYEPWFKKWPKIKGIFTEILPICNELKQIAQQCDRDSIPISIVSTNNETLTAELNQLDQSFMYTQILKETLCDIMFNKKSIKDFTNYCRNQFTNNGKELDIIDKIEREYSQYNPIWWYSNECFLHRMLNEALRLMEVDIIIKMGFFIRDLHCEIEKLYKQQYNNPNQESFIVYRGQSLSKLEFDRIMKTKGGLISFNNFLSTSMKENIALLYARRAMNDSNLMGIVFKIMINPSITSTPFALISHLSFYKNSEQEILFSMHTIFRIDNINQIEVNNHQLWEVELTLTSNSDQQLNELTECMREEIQGLKGWFRIGHLLIKLGQFDKAGQLYQTLLNQTSHKRERGYIYHQLGWIKVNLGNYTEAISFFEESLAIGAKILPTIHPDLATCYDNIGLVYDHMGEYDKALLSHEKALAIYRATLPAHHPDLATSLSNIGLVYYKLKHYLEALLYHKEALDIYHETLPSNHSSLAVSYNNIGLVHDKLNDYAKALWFYDKTLEIHQKTLPPNHPDLAILYQNIGNALKKMCEYAKALSAHQKALNIFQTTFPSDHPHLATCYSYIASVYNNMNQFSDALSYYEKALDIRQKILPSHHPDFITLYNNMGDVYDSMNQYSQALLFYQKVFDICQATFAPDHALLVSIDHKIAEIYYSIDCSKNSLLYVEPVVNIGQYALSSNYSETSEIVTTAF